MERSDSLVKLVSVIVFLALAIYIGISFYTSRNDPLRTINAVGMEIHDSVDTSGYIVRDEEYITASGNNIAVTAAEGEKLSAKETVAVEFSGSRAMERAEKISDIQLRIKQLTAIKNGSTNEELAENCVVELSKAVASGDFSELYALSQDVDAYIISGDELASGNEAEQIAELQTELDSLVSMSESDTVNITADSAGTFSHITDGYEGITPDDIFGLDPKDYEKLFASSKRVGSSVIGKLVHGIKWYYVTTMDEEAAVKLKPGGNAKLRFSKTYSAELNMKVESVGQEQNGKCVVVFSSTKYLQDVTALREMMAEIVFDSETGIRVPQEAVHVDENGKTFVYILEGLRASAVHVDITDENGDYYMVAESKNGLRTGDRIIVKANNLYDGAVVAD